jgi:hypothetical protein
VLRDVQNLLAFTVGTTIAICERAAAVWPGKKASVTVNMGPAPFGKYHAPTALKPLRRLEKPQPRNEGYVGL